MLPPVHLFHYSQLSSVPPLSAASGCAVLMLVAQVTVAHRTDPLEQLLAHTWVGVWVGVGVGVWVGLGLGLGPGPGLGPGSVVRTRVDPSGRASHLPVRKVVPPASAVNVAVSAPD